MSGRPLVFSSWRRGVSFGLAASLDSADEPTRRAPAPGKASPGRGTSAQGRTATPEEQERADSLVFRGQVLDPDGKPVAGAAIVLSHPDGRRPPERLATSGTDGRFEAAVPPASIEEPGPGVDDEAVDAPRRPGRRVRARDGSRSTAGPP